MTGALPAGVPRGGAARVLVVVLLLVAAVVAVGHGPALRAQATSIDDKAFFVGNPLVSHPSWESVWRFFGEVLEPSTVGGYYLPLSMSSLMLDEALGGRADDLGVFHRTSLALHVLVTVVVALLLFRLFGSPWAAGFAALLFGLHPVTVEPVAWVAERKTLLSTLFAVAALLCHVEHARRGGHRWRWASTGFLSLALLSKPTVTMLPVLMLLLDAWPLKRLSRKTLAEKWPDFSLAAISAAVTLASNTLNSGSFAPSAGYLRWPLQIADALGFYLGKLLWPSGLTSLYPDRGPFTLSNPSVLLGILATVGVSAACLVVARRTRAPLVGWLFFLVGLAPTLGLVKYSPITVSDKYLYFPMLGLLLPVGAGLAVAWRSSRCSGIWRWSVLGPPLLFVLSAEAVSTRTALRPWRDSTSLWRHMTATAPGNAVAHNHLGALRASAQDWEEATAEFRRAVECDPTHDQARYNLCFALLGRDSFEAALPHCRALRSLLPYNPDTHVLIAVALRGLGRLDSADVALGAALRLKPDHADAMRERGSVRLAQGRPVEAVECLRRALQVAPGDSTIHLQLGALLQQLPGGAKAAAAEYGMALRTRPDWPKALNALAWIRATSPDPGARNPVQAVLLSTRAVELSHGRDPSLMDTYAAALASAGRFAKAVRTAEAALVMAREAGADSLSGAIRSRAALYARSEAFIDESAGRPMAPPGPRRAP